MTTSRLRKRERLKRGLIIAPSALSVEIRSSLVASSAGARPKTTPAPSEMRKQYPNTARFGLKSKLRLRSDPIGKLGAARRRTPTRRRRSEARAIDFQSITAERAVHDSPPEPVEHRPLFVA